MQERAERELRNFQSPQFTDDKTETSRVKELAHGQTAGKELIPSPVPVSLHHAKDILQE